MLVSAGPGLSMLV